MALDHRRPKASELTDYENLLKNIFKKSWCEWQKDPALLAAQSPLASPYFLCHRLQSEGSDDSNVALGKTLLSAIREASDSFWGEEGPPQDYDTMKATLEHIQYDKDHDHYHAIHLELRFFKNILRPPTTAAIYNDYLLIAKGEEFPLFHGTIRKVGQKLLSLLGQYSKSLPQKPSGIIGADSNLARLEAWLLSGGSVNLTGQSGVGKSTLATFMAHAWSNAAYWYTIRPHLNDRLNTFLFELGHFLHRQGHSNLWKLVLAEGGNVQNSNIALGVLIEDLETYQTKPPLFIIDELDRLYQSDSDQAKPQHIEFLEFLEAIRGQIPTLYVGQQAVLECEHNLELTGLMPVQIAQLLQQRTMSPMPCRDDIETLHQATQGNPRLLLLCIALYESEHAYNNQITFAHIVNSIFQTPGFGPLLKRLWDRLDNRQRELLQRLSVYPNSAPSQYWPTEYGNIFQETVQSLLNLRLIEQHTPGSVALLPALQESIYRTKLSSDLQELYHLDAATVLISLAEYTEAAYHLKVGGESGQAIQAWYPMMKSEIQRGKAGLAYDIFVGMNQPSLPARERRALIEIQAHLHELSGEMQEGLEAIGQIDLGGVSEQRARLQSIEANFKEALGYPHSALESYQRSIDTTARLVRLTANAHYGSSMVYARQHELKAVEEAALKIELELLMLRGLLAQERGELGQAYTIFNEALTIAQKLDNLREVAKIYQKLGGTQMLREQFDDAIWYVEQAKHYYERIGDRLEATKVDNALAAIYLESKNYAEAVRVGEQAVRFFQNSKNTYFAATTQINVAQAYFYQKNYSEAERLASEVTESEEPHVAPYSYYTLGLIRAAKGKYKEAILYFERSLEMAESTDNRPMEAFARQAYGKVLCLDDQRLKGQKQLNRALSQFQRMDKTQEAKTTEKILAEYRSL